MKLKPFAIDILILLLLIPAQVHLKGNSYLLVVPLLFYILLEVWHPLVQYDDYPENAIRARASFLLRLTLLIIMIFSATVLPSVTHIMERSRVNPNDSNYATVYQDVHDGAIQMEYALQFLDNGKNPYAESYADTEVAYYVLSGSDLPANPAIDYLVYLPGLLVASFPLYKAFTALDIFYDQRIIYLMAYILLVFLLPTLVKPPTLKLALLAAVALNPLLTIPVIRGMNDVVVILLLFFTILFLLNNKIMLSALMLGLAFSVKQSAWFMAPFYLLLVYQMTRVTLRKKQIIQIFGLWLLIGIILVLPFALWGFSDFVTDVLAYPSGSVDLNFPIRGFTLGVLLVGSGVISSVTDPFPFWIFQLFFGVPLLFFLLRRQSKSNNVSVMLFYCGVFVFSLGFVSRFFQTNYVGFVTILLTSGMLLGAYLPQKNAG